MEQERKASPAPESFDGSTPRRPRRVPGKFVLMALGAGILLGGLALAHRFADAAPEPKEIPPIPQMFLGWPKQKPDAVLFITGQTHGYLQPCGCSDPQYGGLVRRYNFLEWLRNNQGWNVVPIDLGEIMAGKSPSSEQSRVKYEVNMKALEIMGYAAYGLGETEIKTGLLDTLAAFTAQQKDARPRPVSLNLDKASKKGEMFFDLGVRQYVVVDTPKIKLGITSVVGPDVADAAKGDANVKFVNNALIIPPALKAMKADKADFGIVLYQGNEKLAGLGAGFIAGLVKGNNNSLSANLIVHTSVEEAPPGVLTPVANSSLVTLGHKGRFVGVLGLWKQADGTFQTKYELVSMGPEWTTPKAKEASHPIMRLMESEFAERIAKLGLADRFPRFEHPTQLELRGQGLNVRYVGSEVCAGCHAAADQVWSASGHSHAFKTLEDAVNPKLRDKDGECIVCHAVGFSNATGFLDKNNKAKMNKKLLDVGCESCHGPGSMHANAPNNKDFYKYINGFAKHHNPNLPEKSRLQRIDDFCQKCHDFDNDVNWGKIPFAQKWAKIAHPTPKQGNPPAAQGKQPNPPGVEAKEPEKDAPPKIVEK